MKKKLLLGFLFLMIVYSVGGVIYILIQRENKSIIKNISSINDYPYVLKSNATEVLKKEFKILKENLESDSVNDKEYAISIAKLFIIDLYTINNKINKYDIETQYIYPDVIENYKLNVTNTLYKYVENKEKGKRTQKLPEVSNVFIESEEEIEFDIEKESYKGYKFKVKTEYKENLDYDSESEITVIKKANIYYIAEKK